MRLTLAVAALFAASAAQAGGGAECAGRHMASLDTNSDGFVTREEAAAHPKFATSFDTADANKDGKLDTSELAAGRKAHWSEMRAKGEEHWKSADADASGSLSRAEAETSMPHVAGTFDQLDANRDGELSREEVRSGRVHGREHMRVAAAERFKTSDTNGDGALDLAEAQTGMPWLADKFSTVDANNDGKVTPEEIRAVHKR